MDHAPIGYTCPQVVIPFINGNSAIRRGMSIDFNGHNMVVIPFINGNSAMKLLPPQKH